MPRESGSIYFVFKLMDRGLTADNINRAMTAMIGRDWRELTVQIWRERLTDKGFVSQSSGVLTVDELEALVIGNIKLDHI